MVEISAPKSIRPVPNARARSALRAWCPARERDLKRRHRPTGGMPRPLQQRAEREFGADHVDRGIGVLIWYRTRPREPEPVSAMSLTPALFSRGVYSNAAANASPRVAAVDRRVDEQPYLPA
jgi:hypothetical protein